MTTMLSTIRKKPAKRWVVKGLGRATEAWSFYAICDTFVRGDHCYHFWTKYDKRYYIRPVPLAKHKWCIVRMCYFVCV